MAKVTRSLSGSLMTWRSKSEAWKLPWTLKVGRVPVQPEQTRTVAGINAYMQVTRNLRQS